MKIVTFMGALFLFAGSLSAENYLYSADQPGYQEGSAVQDMSSEATVKIANHPRLGKILTDSEGMTLYMFTPDKNNVSTCYDQCAIEWPPLLVSSGRPSLAPGITGRLGTINRRDNTSQVTYNGMPLYYYFKDKKPGDVTGQNVENKWFVINPKNSTNRQKNY